MHYVQCDVMCIPGGGSGKVGTARLLFSQIGKRSGQSQKPPAAAQVRASIYIMRMINFTTS